jgi:hypothetical protein
VGPRTGMDDMEKRKFLTLPELELRSVSRLARNQSLYRLSYPGETEYTFQYQIKYFMKVGKGRNFRYVLTSN